MDATGRYISFLSTATNLTTNVVAGTGFHLYVRDVEMGTTQLVDAGTNGIGSAKGIVNEPGLTPNARFISFDCSDANLVPNDNNRAYDVFVRDLVSNKTELVSAQLPNLPAGTPQGESGWGGFNVSDDGRRIVFVSEANDLTENDTKRLREVYVHDLLTGSNTLVRANTNGSVSKASLGFPPAAISADGRYVAFANTVSSLVPGVPTEVQNVYMSDLESGMTRLVSVSTNGISSGDNDSFLLSLSADGRFVLFFSYARNLGQNLFPEPASPNLFVRDMQSPVATALTKSNLWVEPTMSRNGIVAFATTWRTRGGYGMGSYLWSPDSATISQLDGMFYDPQISPDGRRLAYLQQDTYDLHIMDFSTRTNVVVAPYAPPYRYRSNPQFSGDGRFLVYATAAAIASSDTNGIAADVYLFDYQSGTSSLISRSYNSNNSGNSFSDWPTISLDGRFISYRSFATDIVPGVTNGGAQRYVYDRQSATTILLGGSAVDAGQTTYRAFSPVFSGDSQSLVFRSWDPNLVPKDFNQESDVFSLKLYSTNGTPTFVGQIVFVSSSGQNPMFTWPATAGVTYEVQFKDNLTDPQWQTLDGSVSIDGSRGFATDFEPNRDHRFYRIMAR